MPSVRKYALERRKRRNEWTNPYAQFTMCIRTCIRPLFSKLQ